jgi:PAS domain-containing protein
LELRGLYYNREYVALIMRRSTVEPSDTSRHSGDFELVFDEAPVGLWEQYMSEARRYVKNLKNRIDGDLEQHLHEHPEKLREIASRIKTLSVNQRLLDMLGARNRDHLLQNLNNIFSKRTYDTFCDEVVSFIEEGQTSYRSEIDVKTLGGEERTVLFDLNARNDDWSRVIVSYRDITDRKKT